MGKILSEVSDCWASDFVITYEGTLMIGNL